MGLQWIIIGLKESLSLNQRNRCIVDTCVHNISEIIMQPIKTKRQINYQPIIPFSGVGYSKTIESPFTVDLGIIYP